MKEKELSSFPGACRSFAPFWTRVAPFLFAAALFALGCATPSAKKTSTGEVGGRASSDMIAGQIEKDDKEINRAYRLGEEAFNRGELDAAAEKFASFTKRFPESGLADDAYFMQGEIALKSNDLQSAIGYFQKIVTDYVGQDLFGEAKFKLAVANFKSGNFNDALQAFNSLLELPLDRRRKIVVRTAIADSLFNLERQSEALDRYAEVLKEKPGEEDERKLKKRIDFILEEKFSTEVLQRVTEQSESEYVRQYGRYALIAKKVDEELYEEAREEIEKEFKVTSLEDVQLKLKDLLQVIRERLEVKSDRIGCILPLSGSYGAYGQKVLKAIQLAAGVFSASEGKAINLVIKDSRGEPGRAAKAVDELFEKDKVIAVIGPLLGSVAEVAAERAQEKGLPLVALSQKMGIPETGNFIFRNSLTARLQTRALSEYFINELSIKRFAILYPTDLYGEALTYQFWNDVLLLGGEVVGIVGYDKEQYDFGKEIKKLVGMEGVNEKKEKEKEEHDRLRPVIDFEAVFIPDSYDKAAMIAPQLVFNDVYNVKLLGPNSWNSPKLVTMGGDYVEGAIFPDGFYADSRYLPASEFTKAFQSAFDERPGTFEAQAYDATKMVVDIIRRDEARSRVEMRDALLLLKDFKGATGKTSVTETGDVDKDLFLLTVKKGEIVEVERAGAEESQSFPEEVLSLTD